MNQLALAFVTVLAASVASDVTFARGGAGGFHGGGHGSGGTGAFHGGGGYVGGKHAGSHGGGWQGGSPTNRWHDGGWHGGWHGGWRGSWYGAGLGIYLGEPPYPAAWPYAYYSTYRGYDPYPVYTSNTTTVSAEPEQQGAPAYYWYYCADPTGYYPYVQNCNDAWLAVVPQR